MPLYSQGHSLAQWLIEQRGKKVFLEFLTDGLQDENWPRAVKKHYGFNDLYVLQNSWLDWVKQGRPQLAPVGSAVATLASHDQPVVIRGQSPDDDITPIHDTRTVAVTPTQPSAPLASTGGSVYVAMAARAKEQGRPTTAASAARSVYDASLPSATIRR
jgi:hypothetical protein